MRQRRKLTPHLGPLLCLQPGSTPTSPPFGPFVLSKGPSLLQHSFLCLSRNTSFFLGFLFLLESPKEEEHAFASKYVLFQDLQSGVVFKIVSNVR